MLETSDPLVAETALLDWQSPAIQALVLQRGWRDLPVSARVGAIHDFVRNEIRFGYNRSDDLPASVVLRDGYGQCNTKATLLMALLRSVGIRCRLHGFTIARDLQRGIVPELIWPLTPANILHSWVEIEFSGQWLDLEGFILDEAVLRGLRQAFPGRAQLCGYGAATSYLSAPPVDWREASTYIQSEGINQDFGLFASPDDFYRDHRQDFDGWKGLLYRHLIRYWMNWRVERIRRGKVPALPQNSTGETDERQSQS